MLYLNVSEKRTERLDQTILDLMICYEGTMLAGGAVRDAAYDVEISDYDMFFTDRETLQKCATALGRNGFECTFVCPQGQLYSYKNLKGVKVQLIAKRFYVDMEDLLNSFDFNATYFGTEGDASVFVTKREAIKDVKSKVLTMNNLEFPSATINRLYKYRNKGYYVGVAIKQIVGTIADMDDYNPEDDQLYVD